MNKIAEIKVEYHRFKPVDRYNKLRAFAIILVTDDKNLFCRCYRIASGHIKPCEKIGNHTWHLIQDRYHKKYLKKY